MGGGRARWRRAALLRQRPRRSAGRRRRGGESAPCARRSPGGGRTERRRAAPLPSARACGANLTVDGDSDSGRMVRHVPGTEGAARRAPLAARARG